jgi:hypothetical protein
MPKLAGNTEDSVGLYTITRTYSELTMQTPTISYLKKQQISNIVERQ